MSNRPHITLPVFTLLLVTGCTGSVPPDDATAEPVPAKPGLRTTTEIGEHDPAAGKEIVSDKVQISNPVTGALEAYQPLKDQVTKLAITRQLQLFQATEGRYPKDHAEFMEKIIRGSGIRLPALPPGRKYEYDVQKHELVIVQEADNTAR